MADACTQGLDTGFVALGYAKVAFLGVVQGITELLPISSTAHMRVVPALLGGPRDILVAQLIEFNINQTLNWPFAAALSTVLLIATMMLYWVGERFFGLRRLWGAT